MFDIYYKPKHLTAKYDLKKKTKTKTDFQKRKAHKETEVIAGINFLFTGNLC